MVTDIAEFPAQRGKDEALGAGLLRGLEIIRAAEGCRSARLCRSIEGPERFIYEIEWETLEDHTVRFRGGPRFAEYRSHINGLFVEPVIARHFERLEG